MGDVERSLPIQVGVTAKDGEPHAVVVEDGPTTESEQDDEAVCNLDFGNGHRATTIQQHPSLEKWHENPQS